MRPCKGIHVTVVVWNHDNLGAFKSKDISKVFALLVLFLRYHTELCQLQFKIQKSENASSVPHSVLSSPHSLWFFSYLTIFPPHHGQPNTFIIFRSTNKAIHWSEVLSPHNDPLSESHCSYTQDNYSTLQLERSNYWERCSSKVRREGKRD